MNRASSIRSMVAALSCWLLACAWLAPAYAAPPDLEAQALKGIAEYVKAQPEVAGSPMLGAAVSQEGHWTLVNRAGERMTASSPAELTRVFATLQPATENDPAGPARLTLVLSEATLFKHRASLKDLPRTAIWRTMVDGKVYPVQRSAPDVLQVEVRPRVLVDVAERAAFDEAMWQLARPLRRSEIRLITLETGGPQSLAPVAKIDTATQRPLPDAIDPAAFSKALSTVGGQTVIVSGKVEGDTLLVRSGSGIGTESSLMLPQLKTAAEAADVNLVVLRGAASRQPGTRNWLWLRVEVKGLATAMDRPSLGDFLGGLMPDKSEMRITATMPAEGASTGRTLLTATVPTGGGMVADRLGQVGAVLSSAVSEVTGQVTLTGIDANMRSAARQRELDRRLLPWINSFGQFGYLGLVLAGLGGLPVALRWFGRIWPAESRADYEGMAGYLAARAVRGIVFGLIGLPLLAIPALIATILGGVGRMFGRPPKAAH